MNIQDTGNVYVHAEIFQDASSSEMSHFVL